MAEPQKRTRERPRTQPAPRVFSREMIKRYLDGQGLTYLRDAPGDFRVDFAHDDDLDCALSFWIMAVGADDEILGVEARSTRRFSRESWDWALYVVNEWNKRMRYPKAYFFVAEPHEDKTGEIRLDQYVDLEKGIHQQLFDSIVFTVMGGATRFWGWMKEQNLQRHFAYVSEENRLDG
jgi:Putative bacterial sensory transduction regulator